MRMDRWGRAAWSLALLGCGTPTTPAGRADPAAEERVCFGDDMEEIEDGTSAQQERGLAVGMLRWAPGTSLAGDAECSGSLVAPNLFLTAGHCVDPSYLTLPSGVSATTSGVCGALEVAFGFQLTGGAGGTPATEEAFACGEVLEFVNSATEDMALVRLEGDPGQRWGWLELDPRAPVDGEDLEFVHHPAGDFKKLGTGEVDQVYTDWIFTTVDTMHVSSGGPVIEGDGQVFGIMSWQGGTSAECDSNNDGNYATRVDGVWTASDHLDRYDFLDQDQSATVEAGDWHGFAVATGDFDCDGYGDVAMSAPYDDVTVSGVSHVNAGAVTVRYGSATGLDPDSEVTFHQGNFPGGTNPEAEDRFGYRLGVGDFDDDGCDDLVVGTPYEDWGSSGSNHGVVHLLHGGSAGLDTTVADWFTAADLGGADESGALFGWALADGDLDDDGYPDLVVGAPKDDDDATDAGRVFVAYGDAAGLGTTSATFDQVDTATGSTSGSDEFGTALAVGDFDNDGYPDLAVGAPGESTGTTTDSGYVTVIRGSATGLTVSGAHGFAQSSVGGATETNDRFGSVLASADFDTDGHADLAIGVPDEDQGATDSGAVNVRFGASTGLTGGFQQILQSSGVGDTTTIDANDRFGASLAVGNASSALRDDLFVGMPGHDGAVTNEGLVVVWHGRPLSTLATPSHVDAYPLYELGLYDELGGNLATGDVDDDGLSEIVAGMPKFDRTSAYDSGAVLVTQP